MIFPAWFDLVNDDVVAAHPTAIRVYVVLCRNPFVHFKPQRTPAWHLANTLHVDRGRASRALRLLIERGYVLEHDREAHKREGDGARYLTVPVERQSAVCENTHTRQASAEVEA